MSACGPPRLAIRTMASHLLGKDVRDSARSAEESQCSAPALGDVTPRGCSGEVLIAAMSLARERWSHSRSNVASLAGFFYDGTSQDSSGDGIHGRTRNAPSPTPVKARIC